MVAHMHTYLVCNHMDLLAIPHRNRRSCRAQINALEVEAWKLVAGGLGDGVDERNWVVISAEEDKEEEEEEMKKQEQEQEE